MKQFVILFMFLTISCSTNKINEISNSKWEWKLDKHCVNFLEFEEEKYYEYNCELGEKWSGRYYTVGDTIFLNEPAMTSDVPKQGKPVLNVFKMIIIPNKGLATVYSKIWINDGWDEKYFDEPKTFYTLVGKMKT